MTDDYDRRLNEIWDTALHNTNKLIELFMEALDTDNTELIKELKSLAMNISDMTAEACDL